MLLKKNKIIGTVCAAIPVVLLLACGTVKETSGIVTLLEEQEAASTDTSPMVEFPVPPTEEEQTVFVHICGEVVYPGVYEVPAGSRLFDVLLLAGGFTEEAAQDSVNMAKQAVDGMQVVVPSLTAEDAVLEEKTRERSGLVNINTASEAELCTLSGIGPSRAAAIIAYRDAHGGFSAIEEIMQVDGIKSATYEKLRNKIYVE